MIQFSESPLQPLRQAQGPQAQARPAAAEVYAEKQTAVKSLLARLNRLVDRHGQRQEQQPADWGYVGDLAHVEERLKEMVGFLIPSDLEVEP